MVLFIDVIFTCYLHYITSILTDTIPPIYDMLGGMLPCSIRLVERLPKALTCFRSSMAYGRSFAVPKLQASTAEAMVSAATAPLTASD